MSKLTKREFEIKKLYRALQAHLGLCPWVLILNAQETYEAFPDDNEEPNSSWDYIHICTNPKLARDTFSQLSPNGEVILPDGSWNITYAPREGLKFYMGWNTYPSDSYYANFKDAFDDIIEWSNFHELGISIHEASSAAIILAQILGTLYAKIAREEVGIISGKDKFLTLTRNYIQNVTKLELSGD